MAPASEHPDPYAAYAAFVRELASTPDCSTLVERLRQGHVADQHGWCTHSSHAQHWEPHPCPILRLATLIDSTPPQH